MNNEEFVEMVTKGRDEIFGDADKILQYNDVLLNEIRRLKDKLKRIESEANEYINGISGVNKDRIIRRIYGISKED